jgi:hypothetical protein
MNKERYYCIVMQVYGMECVEIRIWDLQEGLLEAGHQW